MGLKHQLLRSKLRQYASVKHVVDHAPAKAVLEPVLREPGRLHQQIDRQER